MTVRAEAGREVPATLRGAGGFTLVEVLIAMVILAVGLLGLQALSITAARNTAHAAHRTEMAAAATAAIEARTLAIHAAGTVPAPGTTCTDLPESALRVCTSVSAAGAAGSARIEVEVTRTIGMLDPYTVSSYVYIPPPAP